MNEQIDNENYDILFVFPLMEEFEIFLELYETDGHYNYAGTTYYIIKLPDSSYNAIAIVLYEAGISKAIQITQKFLDNFKIKFVVLLGIAGSLDTELKLGDIVIPNVINEYQTDSKAIPSGESYKIIYSGKYWKISYEINDIVNNFKFVEKELFTNFQKFMSDTFTKLKFKKKKHYFVNNKPNCYVGPVLSGNTVVGADAYKSELKIRDRKSLAIEMESAGIFRAAQERINPVMAICIRGISDFANENKSNLDKTKSRVYRKYAMISVSVFFGELYKSKRIQELISKQFSFLPFSEFKLKENQKKILKEFSQQSLTSKNVANMYLGALKVLTDESNPDRFFQSAYSISQITFHLTEHVLTLSDGENPHLEKIKTVTTQLDILHGTSKEIFINKWYELKLYFENLSKHLIPYESQEFEQNLLLIEYIFSSLLFPVYDIIEEIDNLLKKDIPNREDIEKLRSLINKETYYLYFFTNLKNPNWLSKLDNNGFFNMLPKKGDRYAESIYLLEIASKNPRGVLQIIKRLSTTDHIGVLVNFTKAILKMPSGISIELLDEVKIWIEKYKFISLALTDELKKLIKKFLDSEFLNQGFELATIILRIEKNINSEE